MTELQALDLSADEQLTAAERSVELLTQKLLSIGPIEEIIKLAKKNLDTLKQSVKTNPKLAKLLEHLSSNQEEKIMFIAFFHDLALSDDTQA
jgi:F0F1-type ATP synthase delta subunit